MMADEGGDSQVVDLLGDDYTRTILERSREEPQSVEALSDACDADPSTIYRRIERLQEADLLEDYQQIDTGGHHYKVYATRLREVRIRLGDEGFDVDVEREDEAESAADRFTRLYEGFK